MNIAVCCIVKDEPINYLKEFIRHHIKIGFDTIFIYDNNDLDNKYQELKNIFLDKLQLIPFKGVCKQFDSYIDCTLSNKDNFDWIAYIDVDEFIEVERSSIKDILQDINAPALAINWQIFGTGKYNGISEISSFNRATDVNTFEPNRHIKVIANPKEIDLINNPHNFKFKNNKKAINIFGDEIDNFFTPKPTNKIIWINHYYCRTEHDKIIKLHRGRADVNTQYDKSIFDNIDINTHYEQHSIDLEQQRNKRIALITPTGNRPFQIQQCAKYMKYQNFTGYVDWYIIDDCSPLTSEFINKYINRKNWTIHILCPKPIWKEGDNTQGRNIIYALTSIVSSKMIYDGIFFIEDDDWYSYDYLQVTLKNLINYDIMGSTNSIYFNIPKNTYQKCNNTQHASLCQTAISPKLILDMINISKTNHQFFDMDLWKLAKKNNYNINLFRSYPDICIGIKGLPGRGGIGNFHNINNTKNDIDNNNKLIIDIMGLSTYKIYKKYNNEY